MKRQGVTKALAWTAVAVIAGLAILLPVVVVTGMFGGQPLWGTVALVGLMGLAFGVAWYVRTRGGTIHQVNGYEGDECDDELPHP